MPQKASKSQETVEDIRTHKLLETVQAYFGWLVNSDG